MRASRLPFSLLLPALDLVLWVFLALIPVSLFYYGFLVGAEQDQLHPVTSARERQLEVKPQEVASQQLEVAMDWRGRFLTTVNLPGLLVEVLTSLGSSWPESWHPDALELFSWRALVFPLYALPAWWFAGVSLDALLGRRRVHWVPVTIALLLFAFCALMVVVIPMDGSLHPSDNDGTLAGMALWAVLFGLAPVAWWRQRRRDRLPRHAESAPERLI